MAMGEREMRRRVSSGWERELVVAMKCGRPHKAMKGGSAAVHGRRKRKEVRLVEGKN